MKIKKAIIPAGGYGTRFLPVTKAVPKELLPIVDKPMIQYIVEEARASGIELIILIVNHGKEAIEDHFDINYELEDILGKKGNHELLGLIEGLSDMIRIVSIRQKRPLGLGHAVLQAKHLIGDEPFAVILGDDIIDAQMPCLLQMAGVYEEYKRPVIAVQRVPREETSRYGIIKGRQTGKRVYTLDDVVEKPLPDKAPSTLAIIGRYILVPEIFDILERIPAGAGGELQLTDGLRELLGEKGLIGYEFEGDRYDGGDKLGFLFANIAYAMKRPEIKDKLLAYMKGFQ
ncbi:MAG: UTP--glucose-1-phosphate uridylyltransferase GalU [Deltaproteobacteria bacterium]|nr:UTP--glucose-1-phosphate uridylyltransferase GalU [Deltaproteobacteria bacterium]MCL5276437.1 UTP--glucose-1-phosphate uridylyltransferase GalU [Deltaproteobacteria bacterium]